MTHHMLAGMATKKITRADLRAATLLGLKMVRSDPKSLKLTPGQRENIINGRHSHMTRDTRPYNHRYHTAGHLTPHQPATHHAANIVATILFVMLTLAVVIWYTTRTVA